MDKSSPGTAAHQTITASLRQRPDGSVRVIFCLAPSGQYVGQITADSADPQALALMAGNFANWAQQNRGGLQVAGAGTLSALDQARAKALNGAN